MDTSIDHNRRPWCRVREMVRVGARDHVGCWPAEERKVTGEKKEERQLAGLGCRSKKMRR